MTLTSDAVLNFGAEGGEAEITYTLENAVEGTELTASCEANWVKVVAADKVRVTVEANDGEAIIRPATSSNIKRKSTK